ncbi:Rhodanese-like domain [Carpediemonas membranifera]|uniref:Rhodanese-like domain n=1 Tax=Carpediemonas membranifera TaxID=201153 RepID=A0A8J6B654_9EUKA|nr:Rhodanese-like domain [Carpediemonas membranifera]|eukprot:KAG9396483.1 Rhodanese-like domain [Carpediemonas membranifera]
MAANWTEPDKTSPSLGYIQPEELHALLIDPENRKNVYIIDVRDNDIHCGHIRGSANIPLLNFTPELIATMAKGLIKTHKKIVFHCMMSQARGPKAANQFFRHVLSVYPDSAVEILILSGGFSRFGMMFHEDSRVVTGFDAETFEQDIGFSSF